MCWVIWEAKEISKNWSSVLYYTSHFYFYYCFVSLCFLKASSQVYVCVHMCAHTHAPLYIFLLFDYLEVQYTWLFLVMTLYIIWITVGISEHLKCSRQGSLHISERKAATNTELYWKRSQILMENINAIKNSLAFIY